MQIRCVFRWDIWITTEAFPCFFITPFLWAISVYLQQVNFIEYPQDSFSIRNDKAYPKIIVQLASLIAVTER